MSAQGPFYGAVKEQGSVGLPKRARFTMLETILERARFTQLENHPRQSKVHSAALQLRSPNKEPGSVCLESSSAQPCPTFEGARFKSEPCALQSTARQSKFHSIGQTLHKTAPVSFRTELTVSAEFTFLCDEG